MLKIKRIYEPADPDDGRRILVDRLWPRGISRETAQIDTWLKEIAPSDELRRWYGHDQQRWAEFQRRYRVELLVHAWLLEELGREVQEGNVTLLYAAQDTEHNNAAVLRDVLDTEKKE